ncbi:type II toxin-antitoxin system Phd/YefM family antitoxin [Inhella sp.]|uniref:type II toxin-antitoxin system Phd/YefM family antitoxin n=1 Tax=Inhella sp. TaxID=1921806 RepID=UPI0035B0D213
MAETVNVHDAKTHFSRLLDKAHAGEEIILCKAGKPYARLMPLAAAPGQRQPGRLKQSGAQLDEVFFEPLPVEELEAWDGHR